MGPRDPIPTNRLTGMPLTDRQRHHLDALDAAAEMLAIAMHAAEGTLPPGEHQEHIFSGRRMAIAATHLEITLMMAVVVIRDCRLVEKTQYRNFAISDFPAPRLSRMTPFESPVTGKEISSWRERDRDMAAAGAVDPRDLPTPKKGRKKEAENARR